MPKVSNKKTRTQELLEAKVWDDRQDGKKLSLTDLWKSLNKPKDEETD